MKRVSFPTFPLVVSMMAFAVLAGGGEPKQWQTYDGYQPEGYGRHLVFVSGDEEYRSEEALPMLAKIMAVRHGFRCTVLFAQDPEEPGIINPQHLTHIPGLEALRSADLMVIATRFRQLPDEQMEEIDAYLRSGRPVVGLRTANHGFRFPEDSKWHHYSWRYQGEKKEWAEGFGGMVLGAWFFSHHGWHGRESTRGIVAKGAERHEILQGIERDAVWGPTDVYGVKEPIPGQDVEILLRGQVLTGMKSDDPPIGKGPYEKAPDYIKEGSNDKNNPMQALAWTRTYQLPGGRQGRAFHTTLGSSLDLMAEGSRRLVVNSIFWCLGMQVPAESDVSFVDAYEPSPFKTHKRPYWEQRQLRVSDFDLKTRLYESSGEPQEEFPFPYFDVTGGRSGMGYEFAGHPVNRHRLYQFYRRQAEYHLTSSGDDLAVLPNFPGLDAGVFGHWGKFHKNGYKDRRWNLMEHGPAFSGIFRAGKDTHVRGIAVRLSEDLSCAFDPVTLRYTHLWEGGMVEFQPHRWGIGGGISPDGKVIATNLTETPPGKTRYLGHLRHGDRVVFHYEVDGKGVFDSPGLDGKGEFQRSTDSVELGKLFQGGAARWSQTRIIMKGQLGTRIPGSPFAIDRIPLPLQNEFGSVMLLGGHDFFSNGDAAVCTMAGDVWRVEGLDESLEKVTWTRIASGLSQALGLSIHEDQIYVVGRDRITRLHDLNGDGEMDYYENFADDFPSSAGGHDFYTGLQRDGEGYFYFVAANSGVIRVAPDGSSAEAIATGLRNANGIGASPHGSIVTTSTNEGDWTPASAVFEVRDGDFYGRGAKQEGPPIAPALVYLPRGIDNSSGGQVFANSKAWGPLGDKLYHFGFGSGTWMMILRDTHPEKRTQGALVPLPGDFESGTHRGRFHPVDGQLYVTGADGWGNYAITDGDFARIRYTGEDLHLPIGWTAHRNGLVVEFAEPLDPRSVRPDQMFAQMWNYEYTDSYGSLEYSVKTPDVPGHDRLEVRSAHLLAGGTKLFVEIPDLEPAMQAHLYGRLRTASGADLTLDLYPTILWMRKSFSGYPGFKPETEKGPQNLELRVRWPVPFEPKQPRGKPGRKIRMDAMTGLQFSPTEFRVKREEAISIEFKNTDSIPHNWVLVTPGAYQQVGVASNLMLTNPKIAEMHYVPDMDEVLHYTPMVYHNRRYTLHIQAPSEPGEYPFLCTFPGHWTVMKGTMIVE